MLTLTHTETPRTISDLAAGLTDQTLEILHRAGVRGGSVEMELEAWRALTDEIEHEIDLLHTRPSPEDDFGHVGVIEQAIHRAALRVAGAFDPWRSPAEIEARVRPGVASLRVSGESRAAVERLAPPPRPNRRPLGRSGLLRRLQVTALS